MQAFRVPAGVSGAFEMRFAGDALYRWSLLIGAVVSLLTVAFCLWVRWRRLSRFNPRDASTQVSPLLTALAVGLVPGAVAVGLAWAVRRFTAIPAWGLSAGAAGFMGLWLARAPWPGENYAGSSVLVLVAGCVAVAALAFPDDER